jgi:hypothetical protein
MPLEHAIALLASELVGFRGSGRFILPDIVLFNYITDVQEQARAVQVILNAGVARAGFVNARAALEAAIDAAYLVGDSSEYMFRGARARVLELFEGERLGRRAGKESTTLPGCSQLLEDAVRSDAGIWEQASPGARTLMHVTLEHFCKNPPGIGDHWSGLNRIELYRSFAATEEEKSELATMLDFIYGFLSVQSHPRPRTSQRTVAIEEDDTMLFTGCGTDSEHVANATVLAIRLAVEALKRRKRMDSASSY